MDWTPNAETEMKKVPPLIQEMVRNAVEAYAAGRGIETVTVEILHEAKAGLMGKPPGVREREDGLNVGVSRRETMHLTDERRPRVRQSDDPLHKAFDHKMTVHAMPEYEPAPPEQYQGLWDEVMSGKESLPLRTLYIHIPFCEGRCNFCGFFQNYYKTDQGEQYVKALVREMEVTADTPFVQARPFQAVYFGGGTPTALSSDAIATLVENLGKLFPLSKDCEITLESRFHHLDGEKIRAASAAGVNRFSLGVQTFDTGIRKALGRREPGEKVIDTLTYLRDLGEAVIIIDLIYGLPGQSMEVWERDIRTFLALEIDGCDLYQLNVFTGGLMDRAIRKGKIPRPAGLQEQGDYFVRGVDLMEDAHYHRLSISHWGRTTRERNLYNLLSRGRSECVPMGSGAGGWLRNHMFFVEGNLENYFKGIEEGKKPVSLVYSGSGKSLLFTDISYQMELGYCDLKGLSARHGIDLVGVLEPITSQWEETGLVEITGDCLYLTRPGEFWAVNLAQIMIDFLQGKWEYAPLTKNPGSSFVKGG